MVDRPDAGALALGPVMCEQKPAASFGEPVDLNRSPAISCSLHQAFVAEAQKVSMELVAMAEWQTASNLTGVMPPPVSQGFKYEVLQFSALSHRAILSAFVSTLLFVMGTRRKAQRLRETAKASTLQTDTAREFACNCSRYVCAERFVSNAQKI